jgi:sulfotransferase
VKNPYQPSLIYDYKSGGTVYMHVNNVTGPLGLVGYALDALRQAVHGMQASRLMLVQYESLVENPGMVLNEIYKFIGQDAFQHDFDNVRQEAVSYDEKMGAPGLHSVLMVYGYVQTEVGSLCSHQTRPTSVLCKTWLQAHLIFCGLHL